MPAAAVIRGLQALSGIIGRKASAGGLSHLLSNPEAQLRARGRDGQTRDWERQVELSV